MDFRKTGTKIVVSEGLSAVILFAGLTYFARELTPYVLGIFFIFRVLVDLFGLLTGFGLNGAVEKRISEGDSPGETISSAIAIKLLLISGVAVVLFAFRGAIADYAGADIVVPLLAAVVVREVGWLLVHAMRGELRVGETAPIELARHVAWMGTSALLVYAGYQLSGLVAGYVAGLATLAILGWYGISFEVHRPSADQVRDLLEFSRFEFVVSLGRYVNGWLDVALIGLFLSQSDVTFYEYAWQVTVPVLILGTALTQMLFPQISRWSANAEVEKIESVIARGMGTVLYFAVPALVGAVLLGEPLLRYLFGEPYAVAAIALVVLTGEKGLQLVNHVLEPALRGLNKPSLAARATVIAVGTNLALNLLLIPRFGIVGAAVATTTGVLLDMVVLGYYLSRFVSIDVPYRVVGWSILGAAVMAGVLSILEAFVPIESLAVVVVAILSGGVLYLATTAIFPTTRRQIVLPGLRTIRSAQR